MQLSNSVSTIGILERLIEEIYTREKTENIKIINLSVGKPGIPSG